MAEQQTRAFQTLPPKALLSWLLILPASMLTLALLVWLFDANLSLFHWINGMDWPAVERVWSSITVLGDTLTLLLLLLLFIGRRSDLVWSVVVALVVVSLLLHGAKIFFDMPRPPRVLMAEELRTIGFIAVSGSFPSGHTAAAFAFAGAIGMLQFPAWLKWSALSVAVLVGVSRIVVGIHWPLDVLVGAAVGWLGMALSIWLALQMPWGTGVWAQRVIAVLLIIAALYALWGFDGGYPAARWVYVVLPLLVLSVAVPRLLRLFGVGR